MRTREDVNDNDLEAVLQEKFSIPEHMKPLEYLLWGILKILPKNLKKGSGLAKGSQ